MATWVLPAIILGLVLYLARSVIAPFIVAGVLAYVFGPVIDEIELRVKAPRSAIVALIYVALLLALGLGIWFVETRVVGEARQLGAAGPDIVDVALLRLLGSQEVQIFGQAVNAHTLALWANERLLDLVGNPTDALHVAERALDTVLKTFLTLVALFYLLLDGRRAGAFALRFVPVERRDEVGHIGAHVHRVLSRYIRGQLFLVVLMSILTYVALGLIFHLPYALPIAILTGFLEVIPLLGPVTAGAVAATVALVHGGVPTAVGVIVAYVVLRQAEDQLVMPVVVGRAVELHPLVNIFAVLVGAASFGVLGALLAVPAAAALRVLLDYLYPPAGLDDEERARPLPTSDVSGEGA